MEVDLMEEFEDTKAQIILVSLASILIEKGVFTGEEYQQRIKEVGSALGYELDFKEVATEDAHSEE
jgi:hypothetical protein